MSLRSLEFPTDHGLPLMLSREQQAILAHEGRSAIVAALAGVGKTTTLACKVVQACRSGKAQRILVLTYSRAGVAAFHHRLGQLVREVPPQVQITTVERWAAQQIRRRDPGARFLADRVALLGHVRQAHDALRQRLSWHPDPRFEDSGDIDLDAFWDFNLAAKKSMLPQRLADEGMDLADFCEEQLLDYRLACLFFEYERRRIDHCGDPLYYAEGDCSHALAAEALQGLELDLPRYDLVVLDEMHDLDPAALQLLRALLGPGRSAFIGAGDFNQHIEPQAWSVFRDKRHQLGDLLPQATDTLGLTQSRRFGPQVAKAVNALFGVGLTAAPTRHSTVVQLLHRDDAQCIDQLLQIQAGLAHASAIQAQAAESARGPASLTVILRHEQDACALEWAIHRAGKTASFYGFKRFYLQREIALLLGLCHAHGMQALSWKAQPGILGREVLAAFVEGALFYGKGSVSGGDMADSASRHTLAQRMAEEMQHNPQIIWRFLSGESSLQGGQRNFKAFGNFLQLPLALQSDAHTLLEQADVWGLFAATPLTTAQAAGLRLRVQSLMDAVAGMGVQDLLAQVTAMESRFERAVRAERGFDFQLTTIEEAKGKEYDHVALPFMAPGRFPATVPHSLAFLERNRLYVAMTRAKKRLWLLEREGQPVLPFG
ncbi:DNA helicase IV [Delftia tsuruhatensis]|nr:DNA helicase IV [Delftia tsuruhatensis]CAC9684378.1 DNA helicase IV [Delftia tsuruhatensis]